MDLHHFFGGASSSASAGSAANNSSDSEEDDLESVQPEPKKHCPAKKGKSSQRKYNKKWEKDFPWLEYDQNYEGAFCKVCRKRELHSQQKTGGAWITKPFKNWKKAVEKMKAHSKSDNHIRHTEEEVLAARMRKEGSVLQQLHVIGEQEKVKHRKGIKALLRCTHFLTRQHIPHTTNFTKLVDLIISCGGEDLKKFIDTASRNATYSSTDAVHDFIEAIGTWVDESQLYQLQNASFFSLMADECTDIATIEELSIFCRWMEDGKPVEHFMDIIPLKKADAESIYSLLVDWLTKRNIQLGKLVGMGFDGAATFSGKNTGVQARLRENSPHALFMHCRCHLLQLACVQAANKTNGIKHVYTTLIALWKFFHYSPKRTGNLKEVQSVLDLPELKIVKPSDTRWLAHEKCVKVVKANYAAIVVTLENIYEQTHEPEALGISKIFSRESTLSAMYLLDFALPQVAKLSKCLQTEKLDLTAISSLVDATLCTLNDALLPAANWVLELLDAKEEIEAAIGIHITSATIASFQDSVAKHFITDLKNNIASRFASQDVVSSFSIFDPKKMPPLDSPDLSSYGEKCIETLLNHYGKGLPAKSVLGEAITREPLISSDLSTEWKTYRRYITQQPKENMKVQLKELTTNDMLKTMFPDLNVLAGVCLTIPVGTASVERSFSQMKMIKTRLRNRLKDTSLFFLMKIAIESPETLLDKDLDDIINIWNRKPRRIVV